MTHYSRDEDVVSDFGSIVRRTFGAGSLENNEDKPRLFQDVMEASSLGVDTNATSNGQHPPLDLHTLWKLLEKMEQDQKVVGLSSLGEDADDFTIRGADDDEGGKMSTWELVVLQAVLLSLLILVSLLWAFCCKRRCNSDPIVNEMVALARKISGGSSKDLPPSYSKTDLTSVGLTVNDHLNPPPSYDRAACLNLMELERKSGVRQQMSTYSVSSISSLASTNLDHVVDIENHHPSTPRRNSSRVTFSPVLETGPTERKRPASLPLVSVLVKPDTRKRSTQSEGGDPSSRKPSFLNDDDDFVQDSSTTSANNLNSQPRSQPMI